MNPTIQRKRSADPFARIPKTILDDDKLSWKSKGILCYLLGKPNEWKAQVADIVNNGCDSSDSVRTGLMELRKAGYAELQRLTQKGRVVRYVLAISDTPEFKSAGEQVTVALDMGNTPTVKPDVEKPDLSKNDISKNDGSKKEIAAVPPVPLSDPEAARKVKHTGFVKAWCEGWEETYGERYQFTPQDGAALKRFLVAAETLDMEELFKVARLAWGAKNDAKMFNCSKHSGSIMSFLKWYNEIKAELKKRGDLTTTANGQSKWGDIAKA